MVYYGLKNDPCLALACINGVMMRQFIKNMLKVLDFDANEILLLSCIFDIFHSLSYVVCRYCMRTDCGTIEPRPASGVCANDTLGTDCLPPP